MSERSRPDSKPVCFEADTDGQTLNLGADLPVQTLTGLAESSDRAANADVKAWHGTFSNRRESGGLVD